MGRGIIQNNHLAGPQTRRQKMGEEVQKNLRVERAFITEGRFQPLPGQRAHRTDTLAFGGGLLTHHPLAAGATPVVKEQVQAGAGFIEKHYLVRIDPGEFRLIVGGQLLDPLGMAVRIERCFFYS